MLQHLAQIDKPFIIRAELDKTAVSDVRGSFKNLDVLRPRDWCLRRRQLVLSPKQAYLGGQGLLMPKTRITLL